METVDWPDSAGYYPLFDSVVPLVHLVHIPLADVAVHKAVLDEQQVAARHWQLTAVIWFVVELSSHVEVISTTRRDQTELYNSNTPVRWLLSCPNYINIIYQSLT